MPTSRGGYAARFPDNGRVLEMTREEFEELVAEALDRIPPELTRLMDNVAVFVEDEPPADDPELLGLYEGTPLTERGEWYAGVLPDRITVYRGPTLRMCASREDVIAETEVTVVHEPTAAKETDGQVPLVLCGHLHHEGTQMLPYGTRLRREGSTGGSGLRAVEHEHPAPIQASILYFDRDSRRLQAWDAIELGGLGLTTAEVSRHLVDENQPGASTPSRSPSPASPSASP
ncbi:metallopeptidase family protein [Streptomyces sp. WELS2]|uniref:metallopeptidase family protein n=1 Tax=Streptomyces sp. WELS2 TaxID=2749435 RepID=UPI002867B5DC|nr:metallopeptidase family protein [Streptomyces sp. WELS2]